MRYIITGPTGSIGVNLIIRLLRDSHNEIWAICNPASGRDKMLPQNARLHIVLCDIHKLSEASEKLPEHADIFVHLAWCGTIGATRNDLKLQLENVGLYIDAVNLAKKHSCNTFVGAGSQAEYGRKNTAITEDMLCDPENGYGAAKLSANHMTKLLCKDYGIRLLWLRIFSVYGPYENFTSLTSSTIIKYLNGETPDFTEGIQLWDYSYAEDVAEAVTSLISNTSCSGIYNISTGNIRPLKDYIAIIAEQCNVCSIGNLGAIPYSPTSVMYLCGDITRLKNDTGCTMSTPFEVGIKKMIDWIKEVKNL